jgi:ribonuclease P protein component
VDFDRIFQGGRHHGGRVLSVRTVANDLSWTRFGYAIPRRVGKAVVRNKLRRRLREALRVLPLKEGCDVLVSVRPEAAVVSFQDLTAELKLLLKRAGLLLGEPREEQS